MQEYIQFFYSFLPLVFSRYLGHGDEKVQVVWPGDKWLESVLPENCRPSLEEQLVLLLALMPHINSQALDLFFLQNKEMDRPYTEFGGWKGVSHSGFLPTGQTALFLLGNGLPAVSGSSASPPEELILSMLGREHWFYRYNILHLEGQGEGEPFLSGRLVVSDEFLAKVLYRKDYRPEYSTGFPAKHISTPLEWEDLVLPYNLRDEIDNILRWLSCRQGILADWHLDKLIKPGYRCLFYGPPGTGKTLTTALLGKQNKMDVYRVDLSMIVSKYIGETEKNLAKVFDKAEHRNWILFFDEADALFGQRTETQSSNDRYANQEVAYLLQRIEDFPGMVILATNLKENIDEAFFRRFQSVLYFPMPDRRMRFQLWKKMIPPQWLREGDDTLIYLASEYKLSGGSIVNVIQNCAIKLYGTVPPLLTEELLKQSLARELLKDGKIIQNQ